MKFADKEMLKALGFGTSLAALFLGLLGAGYRTSNGGGGSWSGDTYTPSSGTFTVSGSIATTGNVTVASALLSTGNLLLKPSSNGSITLQTNPGGSATNSVSVASVGANPTTLDGQLSASHLTGGSGPPTSPTAGTGCGTPSAPVVSGGDLNPRMGVTCGSTGTGANTIVSATVAHSASGQYHCNWACANAATCALAVTTIPFDSTTTTTFVITANGTAPPAGTYLWQGVCTQ